MSIIENQEFNAGIELKEKPVVHYRPDPYDFIKEGKGAEVYALDHPRLGERYVYTSKVIVVGQNGQFETLNTIYVPEQKV